MKKEILAKQLRKRQIDLGIHNSEVINLLSDNEIIDSYITCNYCEKKLAKGRQLEEFIIVLKNTQGFVDYCNTALNSLHRECKKRANL